MKLEVDLFDQETDNWIDDNKALDTATAARIRDSLRWLGDVGEIKIDGNDAAPALTGPELPELTSAHSSGAVEYPPVVIQGTDGEEPEVPAPSDADKQREQDAKEAQEAQEKEAAGVGVETVEPKSRSKTEKVSS